MIPTTSVPAKTDTQPRRQPAFALFLAYVAGFHVAWIAWPYLVYPRLNAFGRTTLVYALLNLGIRFLVWVVPVFLYLRYVDRVDALDYLKLKHRVRRGVVVAVVLVALDLAGALVRFGLPHLSMQAVTWNTVVGTSLLSGFIEEVPYRGFMLQKFAERVDFRLANLITSLLFLAVHLPGWTALHAVSADKVAFIFVFGVVMGAALKYSGSLWSPIVTHSANNFLSVVVFRR